MSISIGSFQTVLGTSKKDRITGLGGQVVFTGKGKDLLTGLSAISADGEWTIPSILSGGADNDTYNISQGGFTIVIDAGGGRDTVIASSMNINNVEFYRINQRDIWATDGNTSVILIDPQGIEGAANRIENFKIGNKKFKLSKLIQLASSSDAFGGDYTYQQLGSSGSINFESAGLDPLQINNYIQAAIQNNALLV
jgi:hypothetical protein